jgi:hypothetical protein
MPRRPSTSAAAAKWATTGADDQAVARQSGRTRHPSRRSGADPTEAPRIHHRALERPPAATPVMPVGHARRRRDRPTSGSTVKPPSVVSQWPQDPSHLRPPCPARAGPPNDAAHLRRRGAANLPRHRHNSVTARRQQPTSPRQCRPQLGGSAHGSVPAPGSPRRHSSATAVAEPQRRGRTTATLGTPSLIAPFPSRSSSVHAQAEDCAQVR